MPEPDDAAPAAILAYLSAYGPATVEGFSNFISRGRVSKRSLKTWFAAAGRPRDGGGGGWGESYARTEDMDELAGAKPTKALRLLPGFDQWVLGPGTDDPRIVAPARRAAVSRQAGWISPLVVVGRRGGRNMGVEGSTVRISWFGENGKPPKRRYKDGSVAPWHDHRARPHCRGNDRLAVRVG